MQASQDEATAYHEAGHAVLALALGRPIHQVSILPHRERLGVCMFGKGGSRPTKDWVEREMLISLGGVAAEARHTGNHDWGAAARDWQYVHSLAVERAGERRAERLIRRLLTKAEHLLSRGGNWEAVERIAAELLRRGTISGRAARHLFEQGGEA
jgi:ATP-dependent Zn protease